MSFVSRLTRLIAALALTSMLAAPAALADRDDRRGHHGDYRGYKSDHRGYRGDHYRYRGDDRHHGKRHYPRHVYRDHGFRHYDYGTAWPRFTGYRKGYYGRPSHYTPRYYAPRYYAPRRKIYTHRPIHRSYHAPRYRIGSHYHRHPKTVIIHDYGRHGLYHPPRGYHWVHDHDSGDAILASIATGAIIGLVVGALSGH